MNRTGQDRTGKDVGVFLNVYQQEQLQEERIELR